MTDISDIDPDIEKSNMTDKTIRKISAKTVVSKSKVGTKEQNKKLNNMLLTPTQINLIEMAKYSDISATGFYTRDR
jgi:hypothetical protein